MPPLPDQDAQILPAVLPVRPRRARPSPSHDHLRLEQPTAREIGYLGHVVGIDVPLIEVDSGFGDVITINTGPAEP